MGTLHSVILKRVQSRKINTYFIKLKTFFRVLPRRYWISLVVFITILIVIAAWPRHMTLSYGGKTCIYQPTVASGLLYSHSNEYRLEPSQKFEIAGVVIGARDLCVVPLKSPESGEKTVQLSLLKVPFFAKQITIHAPDPPRVLIGDTMQKPISTKRSLVVPISDVDRVFSYKLRVNSKSASCTQIERALSCDLASLRLAQGVSYTIHIDRYFADKKVQTVASQAISTLAATMIVTSSIEPDQVIYEKPMSMELFADKDLVAVDAALARVDSENQQEIPVRIELEGKKAVISWDEELARQAQFEILVQKAESTDGSDLDGVYKFRFDTSGGPKVKNISVGAYKVPIGANAIISFDQPLLSSQDVRAAVQATGGAVVGGIRGNQVTVSFASVPRCGDVTIAVSDTLQSEHGITGGSAWRYTTRTICQSQSIIGYSVKGRAIAVHSFGSGADTIAYTGAIHGNELSTRTLMYRWIDELEANPRLIPANKTVVVVPVINPDGVTAGTRTNARNVDLNRNFATADWRSDITTTSNAPFPGGGGESAMSEPETRAVAGLISRLRPQLTLSYHSIGGLLASNQVGNANSYASTYARLSGYANTTGASDAFEYGISGTADDYYGMLGVPSVLIELGSHSYHQFERNREAMWAMLR